MSEPAPLFAPLKPKTVTPRLWKDGAFVLSQWHTVADDVPLPSSGQVLFSHRRWQAEKTNLSKASIPLGIHVAPADELDTADPRLADLAVIVLTFPKFTDGRSYSTARRLRESGYAGEIRATGDILLDQVPLLLRAGFDALEITHAATQAALETSGVPAISRVYQSGAEQRPNDWRRRRAAAGTDVS